MPITYLEYIASVRHSQNSVSDSQFLVSGTDTSVRQIVGEHITASAYSSRLPLFIVDNTTGCTDYSSGLGRYQVFNAISGEISLCSELLEVNTLLGISRLRSLLSDLGFNGERAMKVVTYINFCKETERRLGNNAPLSLDKLEEYSSNMLVKWKLSQLVASGKITEENREYLLGRYAEVSGAAADFESVLVLLAPFMSGRSPTFPMAVHLPVMLF